MLDESEIKITKLGDKNLNEIMEKLQAGMETTQAEKEKLWKGLLKNHA